MTQKGEWTEKAGKIVEEKRRIIREGAEILFRTGGNYSAQDHKKARQLGEESQKNVYDRQALLAEGEKKLNEAGADEIVEIFEMIQILEIEYLLAIQEEVEKIRKKLDEVLGINEDE
jgi:hypothetical protein